MLHGKGLRDIGAHAVAKQDDRRIRETADNPVVDQSTVVDQALPAIVVREVAEMRCMRSVAAMVVRDNSNICGGGNLGETLVALVVLTQTMEQLDDVPRSVLTGPGSTTYGVIKRRGDLEVAAIHSLRIPDTATCRS